MWFTTLSLTTKQPCLMNTGTEHARRAELNGSLSGSVNHPPYLVVNHMEENYQPHCCWSESVLKPGLELVSSRPGFSSLCGEKSEWAGGGGDGQWGDSSFHRIGTIVKPPESPTGRETGRSKVARFLISLLIPPDLIHPGPACCNPSVRYPPMFNMLMPPTKWMNHRGTWACNHFKKDRCINTPENPCLLVDNRLSVSGASNRCVCAKRRIRF